jgi:hypothetical protein
MEGEVMVCDKVPREKKLQTVLLAASLPQLTDESRRGPDITPQTPQKPIKTLDQFFTQSARRPNMSASPVCGSLSATAVCPSNTKDVPSSTGATLKDMQKPDATSDSRPAETNENNNDDQGKVQNDNVEVPKV